MKKIKIQLLVLVALLVSNFTFAQNCDVFMNKLRASAPWEISSYSITRSCTTGNNYAHDIVFMEGIDYRLMFYASSNFNNDLHFIIENADTREELINVPGVDDADTHIFGKCALHPVVKHIDDYNEFHPYFDFKIKGSTKIRIIVKVNEFKEYGHVVEKSGCIKILVLQKKSAE